MVVSSLAVILGLLELVFQLGAHDCSRQRTQDASASSANFVAAKVSCCAASNGTHQTSITFCLSVGVGGAVVLLARLTISVWWLLTLWILVVGICALLRKLVLRLCAGVLTLLSTVLSLLLLGLIVGSYLAMLETAMSWSTVLLVVALLMLASIVALVALLLVAGLGLLITTLVVSLLVLLRVLLAVLLLLVVLVVAGHCCGCGREDSRYEARGLQ